MSGLSCERLLQDGVRRTPRPFLRLPCLLVRLFYLVWGPCSHRHLEGRASRSVSLAMRWSVLTADSCGAALSLITSRGSVGCRDTNRNKRLARVCSVDFISNVPPSRVVQGSTVRAGLVVELRCSSRDSGQVREIYTIAHLHVHLGTISPCVPTFPPPAPLLHTTASTSLSTLHDNIDTILTITQSSNPSQCRRHPLQHRLIRNCIPSWRASST